MREAQRREVGKSRGGRRRCAQRGGRRVRAAKERGGGISGRERGTEEPE